MHSLAPSEIAGLFVLGAIHFTIITVLALCLPSRGKALAHQRLGRTARERRLGGGLEPDAQVASTPSAVDSASQGGRC